jgi:hypothetical protein
MGVGGAASRVAASVISTTRGRWVGVSLSHQMGHGVCWWLVLGLLVVSRKVKSASSSYLLAGRTRATVFGSCGWQERERELILLLTANGMS